MELTPNQVLGDVMTQETYHVEREGVDKGEKKEDEDKKKKKKSVAFKASSSSKNKGKSKKESVMMKMLVTLMMTLWPSLLTSFYFRVVIIFILFILV